jgi:dihydroorotate dehydrogenase electron transfer subunit
MSQYQENATIIRFEQLTDTNIRLTLQTEEIAAAAKPGQFVMIRTGKSKDPLLRRPFSIHQTSSSGRIQILFKVTGRGTALLAHCKEGETLSVFGPLGHGFKIDPGKAACLIGGGMGIAPMLFLAKRICQVKMDTDTDLIILGGRTRSEIEPLLSDFHFLDIGVMVATDDGSYGRHGLVTDVMKTISLPNNCIVYTCGPEAMMKEVFRQCRKTKIECQVSVESVMACGMGACLGCNIAAKNNRYVHVCSDGPVFNAEDLEWNL